MTDDLLQVTLIQWERISYNLMLKLIEFTLTEPLCPCDEQNISWAIELNANNMPGLGLTCKICKTHLSIPNELFRARITFTKPYPGKKKELEPKTKLGVVDGGKVIELKQPEAGPYADPPKDSDE